MLNRLNPAHSVPEPSVSKQSDPPVLPPLAKSSDRPPLSDRTHLSKAQQGSSLTEMPLVIPEYHIVQPGETLSAIAQKYWGDERHYLDIFKLNQTSRFNHPNSMLQVGQKLKLPQDLTSASGASNLANYRQQNPVSYLTLNTTVPSDGTALAPPIAPTNVDSSFHRVFLNGLDQMLTNGSNHEIVHTDAVKVNKWFDLYPSLTIKNLHSSHLENWGKKVANVLDAQKARIQVGMGDKKITLDAQFFRNGFHDYETLQNLFKEELGMAFINTLWAIDDVVSNMKSDPYYQEMQDIPKTIDLASVADDFQLQSDRLNYLGKLASHRHRNIPVILESDKLSDKKSNAKPAQTIITELSQYFNSRGTLTDPNGFENYVYQTLANATARRNLIQFFDLNSTTNLESLIPAITSEAGMSEKNRKYNSYFPVGAVILNRALGKNLKNAAKKLAQGGSLDKYQPVTIRDIMFEQGQFEVAWRKMPGQNSTFYEFNQSQHNAFKKDKLKQDGNSAGAFELAYEVVRDLYSGMHRLNAEVDGQIEKGAGRSTAKLFYFNQSRSHDFSNERRQQSAVKLVDESNTHVFFTAWDQQAYFR